MTGRLAVLVALFGCIEQHPATVDDASPPVDARVVELGRPDVGPIDATPVPVDAAPPPDAAPDAAPDSAPDAAPDAAPDPCPDGCAHGLVCRDACVTLCEAAAIDGAPIGCDYWTAPIGGVQSPAVLNPSHFLVHLINPHADLDILAILVSPMNGDLTEIAVGRGMVVTEAIALRREPQGGHVHRGWRIFANAPIAVTQSQVGMVVVDLSASDDAARLLPIHQLGREYVVTSRQADHYPGVFSIANPSATERTSVEVTVSGAIAAGAGLGALRPGDVLERVLEPADVVTFETAAHGDDLTGSRVRGSGPLAVFAGSEAADVPSACADGRCTRDPDVACATWEDCQAAEVDICCADVLEEQQLPVSALGRHYLAAPSGIADAADYWRIVATADDTEITTRPMQIGPIRLAAGEWIEFAGAESFEIEASAPVAVTQFLPSTDGSDPSMIQLIPIERFHTDHVIAPIELDSFETDSHWFVVTGPGGTRIEVGDDRVIALPHPIGDGPWAWAQRVYTPREARAVRLRSDAPVAVYQFGRGEFASYGTHAGMRTR